MSKLKIIVDDIIKDLSVFLGDHTVHSTDRSKHLVWGYDDRYNKKNICVVFTSNHLHDEEVNEYCMYNGYVLVISEYWINVPKPIALEYIMNYLIEYYKNRLGLKFDEGDYPLDNNGAVTSNCPWLPNWCPCCGEKKYH